MFKTGTDFRSWNLRRITDMRVLRLFFTQIACDFKHPAMRLEHKPNLIQLQQPWCQRLVNGQHIAAVAAAAIADSVSNQ